MKKQILEFEQVEGRSIDARRMFNARILGLVGLEGGKKLGQGLEKCVYDSDKNLDCNKPLPRLPSTQVNVVLSADAYQEEKEAKQKIMAVLDPSVVDRIFITLDDQPTCEHMRLPPKCTSEARKAVQIVLARSEKGSTSKKFESKEAFGYAVVNLVFGLWALHSHNLIHGDVKIEPRANNAVRVGKVYKLIDLGMVMTFDHIKKGIEDRHSSQAQELWNMRKYVYWSVGHLYAVLHLKDVKETCTKFNISWDRVLHLYFENIDLVGFMRSVSILVHLNPNLDLKPLLTQLQATPQDFSNEHELNARKLVWSSAKATLDSLDVGNRTSRHGQEMFLDLPRMYQRIRAYCALDLPKTIQEYGMKPM